MATSSHRHLSPSSEATSTDDTESRSSGVSGRSLESGQQQDFFAACTAGDTDKVESYLKAYPQVEQIKDLFGNNPIHVACQEGQLEVVKLLLAYGHAPTTANKYNQTALGILAVKPHPQITLEILKHTKGNPADVFPDFKSFHRSFKRTAAYPLDDPLKVVVVGDSGAGKSTFIKALQADPSFLSKIFGRALSRRVRRVDQHFTGIITTDTYSHGIRVIFNDLAGHTNYFQEELLESQADLQKSIFIIIVNLTDSHSIILQRLLYWLTFIHYHCNKVRLASATASPAQHEANRPRVFVVGSFYDSFSIAFWPPNWQKLSDVSKSVMQSNPEMAKQFQFLGHYSLNCKKTNAKPIVQFRSHLHRKCREIQQVVLLPSSICYLVSTFLDQEIPDDSAPTLRELSQKVHEKASQHPHPSWHELIPEDVTELYEICQTLCEYKRILLFPNPTSSRKEDWWIVQNNVLLTEIDEKLSSLRSSISEEGKALITLDRLQQTLQSSQPNSKPVELDINLAIQLLEHFRYCEEITHLEHAEQSGGAQDRLFFFPGLLEKLEKTDDDLKKISWSENKRSGFNFAWCFTPTQSHEQLIWYFMPRYLKMLLLCIIRKFITSSSSNIVISCRGASWTTGEGIKACIITNDDSIILSLQCQHGAEIKCLQLRNEICNIVKEEKNTWQPDILTEEFLVLIKEGLTEFPVKQIEDQCRISLAHIWQAIAKCFDYVNTSEGDYVWIEDLLYFEPSVSLRKLKGFHRQQLVDESMSSVELDNAFIDDLKKCLGERGPDLPLHFTLPSQFHSLSDPELTASNTEATGIKSRRNENFTHGKLLEVMDSVALFTTVELLKESEESNISYAIDLDQRSLSSVSVDSLPYRLTSTIKTSREIEQSNLSTVPFIKDIKVFHCTSANGFYKSPWDGIVLNIPEGAIPPTCPSVSIEFGVTLHGPFTFEGNVQPVSPIVWLSSSNFVFEKPIEVSVPHFIDCRSHTDTNNMVFYQAVYNVGSSSRMEGFHFKPCDPASFKIHSGSGTVYLRQLSFLCICHQQPQQIPSKAKYCLFKVIPSEPCDKENHTFQMHFCVTYFLDTCIELVKSQYPRLSEHEMKLIEVRLNTKEGREPMITIEFEHQPGDGWIAGLDSCLEETSDVLAAMQQPSSVITLYTRQAKYIHEQKQVMFPARKVAFCTCDPGDFKRMKKYHMYPPRFTIKLNGKGAHGSAYLRGSITGFNEPILIQEPLYAPMTLTPLAMQSDTPHQPSQRHRSRAKNIPIIEDPAPMLAPAMPGSFSPSSPPQHPPLSDSETDDIQPKPNPQDDDEEKTVQNIIRKIAPDVVEYINMDVIRPHLFRTKVLDTSALGMLLDTPTVQQPERLLVILGRSGVPGLKSFKKALRDTADRHMGHESIIEALDRSGYRQVIATNRRL